MRDFFVTSGSCSKLDDFQQSQRAAMKFLLCSCSVVVLVACLPGCTVLAIADAAGSAVVYGVKTTVNVLDAVTPDLVNKKKD
ncbi:hypothetical protein B9Z45_02300 [Limnohabitans sp. 2KL-17]|nr:hypothetical protein B9Z45_02300 [Limnohabitans sp. 2KL-17]